MNDNTLDNIFKKTFSSENRFSDDDNNLDEFELKLHKKMFYKFSWLRFNVYYMSMIAACFLSSSFLVIDHFTTPSVNTENKSVQNPISYMDSISSEQKTSLPARETLSSRKNKSTSVTPSKEDGTLHNLASSAVITPNPTKDTVTILTTANSSNNAPSITPTPVVLKRKKTIYLASPRDTIVKIDTVILKKGRKK
jgi:cytoskeletal protein RodZ